MKYDIVLIVFATLIKIFNIIIYRSYPELLKMYNREKWSLSVFYVKYICTITTGCATTSCKIITIRDRERLIVNERSLISCVNSAWGHFVFVFLIAWILHLRYFSRRVVCCIMYGSRSVKYIFPGICVYNSYDIS